MKIAILGFGRMGREIEKQAVARGHSISAVFEIDQPLTTDSNMRGADIIIDFTLREAVPGNISAAAALNIPLVEGTTGWAVDWHELAKIPNLTMIFSPNFSIGVYQFTQLVKAAGHLFGAFPEYDCYLHEWHHTGKADSPSGTAKNLANVLLRTVPQKKSALYSTSEGKIAPEELHVTSTRAGRFPGTHEIGFDSPYDLIQLRHQAHGREGFAHGAILAAEWLVGKRGLFNMDDFMTSLTQISRE